MDKTALSAQEIFEKVKDYDLVLTTEAPLADALNSRLKHPKIGHFAITPRRLVYDIEGGPEFRRELFLKLVNNKDLSWKQASYLLDNVLDCWQQTGDLETIKEYEKFQGTEIDAVIDTIRETPNPFSAMEDYKIEDKKVAVVGLHQFNELDKSILPDEYDEIPLFKDEEFEMQEFKIFESAGSIVQAVTETVQNVGPGNVGIVMDPESQYQPLIEARFGAEQIPYLTQDQFSDNENLRTLISLLRIALSREDVRVGDVRPLLEQLELGISRADDNRRLDETDGFEEFKQFLNVLKYLEFEEVIERYEEFTGRSIERVKHVISELGLENQIASIEAVNDLEYFFDSFDMAESKTSEGVLFADPKKVSRVDRPVVIFLGMDSDWTREASKKPWADRDAEERNNITDFKSLIQSGEDQLYLVQDKEMNDDITPCFHLNEILDEDFRNFDDLPHARYRPRKFQEESGFEKEDKYDVKIRTKTQISQSSLNTFVQSPKMYYFDRLVSDADQEAMEKGNLFHDYAEFYVNYPEYTEDLSDDDVVAFMLDEIKELANDLDLDQLKTEFYIGIKNIRSFINAHNVETAELEAYEKGDRYDENRFAEEYDKPIESSITEMSLKDQDNIGAVGKVDLIMNKTHLVDYKSGRQYSEKKLVKKSNVDLYEDVKWPDFQAAMYLAHHRRCVPGEKLKFTFLNFLENIGDQVAGTADSEDNVVTLTYYPKSFPEKAAEMETFENMIRDVSKSNDRRKTLEKLGYPAYQEFFSENKIPNPYDKDKLMDSEFASEFISYAKGKVGDYKYVEKGCKSALRKLVEFRTTNFFKEDLDKFEDFLEEQIAKFNECKRSEFPLDANPDDLSERDLILR